MGILQNFWPGYFKVVIIIEKRKRMRNSNSPEETGDIWQLNTYYPVGFLQSKRTLMESC